MIIMDVGASFGEFAKFISDLDPDHRVIAIEPNPESAAKIKKFQNIEVHEIALDNVAGRGFINLKVSQNPELSSIMRVNPSLNSTIYANHIASAEFSHDISVPVMSLKNFMEAETIPTIDLLKIDAQGKDWDVVISAGDLIGQVKVLILEVCYEERLSLYENEVGLSSIVPQLDHLGFALVWLVPNGGGEANLIAYNRKYGFEYFLRVQDELKLLRAPCLKLNPEPRIKLSRRLRKRAWFVERRLRRFLSP